MNNSLSRCKVLLRYYDKTKENITQDVFHLEGCVFSKIEALVPPLIKCKAVIFLLDHLPIVVVEHSLFHWRQCQGHTSAAAFHIQR